MSIRKLERFFLGATLFSIPFGTGTMFSAVMSADLIMIQDLFMGLTYMFWIYRTNLFSKIHLRYGAIAGVVFLMVVWSVLSMSSAIALQATGIGIYFTIKSFLLYFYLVNNIRTKPELLFVVNMLVFGLLFQGVLGSLQGALGRTLGLDILGERQMSLHKIDSRVRGTMGYPNRFGAVLILLLPLAISMAIFARRSFYKLVLVATSGFGLMALFLSLSRSSWAGFLVAMMIMTVLLLRRGMLKPKFFAAIAVVLVAAMVIAAVNWEVIEARFERGADGRFRSKMINIAYPIIKAYPIFGVGLNNYQWHSFDDFNFWHPVHNEFLRFAAELGIPGAIMFAVLLIVFLREAYRGILLKDPLINAVAIGVFSGIIAFIVAINIGPEYQHYRIKLTFWALAGVTFALRPVKALEIKMKKKKQKLVEQQQPETPVTPERPSTKHILPAHEVRR